MRIEPQEVSAILKQQLAQFGEELKTVGVGPVLQVGDGIALVYGLSDCMAGELIEFPGEVFGLALNLEEDHVGCILLGSGEGIKEGDLAHTTGRIIQVPVGPAMLGRVVNALGLPIDGKGPIPTDTTIPIETRSPGVIERQPVCEPLQTGVKAIDAMTAIGRGQRELIIGDRQTGKTAIGVDSIINQKGKDCFCIYVAIGQKQSTVARVVTTLESFGAMAYTTVVAASASDPAPMQYLAPFAGASMGEYFRDKGQHALIVYDDLTKHAQAYRELSLLLRRPPGREAYPGDIFHLHAHLLERAAKLSNERGGGSLTALPIIETQLGDYAAYIPTNVISITDGQIYLEPELFFAGVRPAMNVGISVSRVGGDAQIRAMKKVAGMLRLDLAYYYELRAFAQFAAELDKETRNQLNRGQHLVELLKQPQYQPLEANDQVIQLFAGTQGYLDDLALHAVRPFTEELVTFVHERYPDIPRSIKETGDFSDAHQDLLRRAIDEFAADFKAKTAGAVAVAA